MAEQVRNPLAVFDVGLTPRHIANVAGIADDDFEVFFEHRINRLPIDARALHGDVRAVGFA